MFKSVSRTEIILSILSWIVLLFSILCSFSVFTLKTHEILICSDAVSVQFIYDDFIAGPGKLKDWYFPTSPCIFPDLTFYSIVQIFHCKFTNTLILYALLQMTIISLLSIYIFKRTVPERLKTYSWLIPLLYSIIFLEAYYFSKDIVMNQLLTSCFYHAGAFVNCLIALSIFLTRWPALVKYSLLLVFSALAIFSDMLYLVMFIVPFSFSVLFTMTKVNRKQIILAVLSIAIGSIAGHKIYTYAMDSGMTYFFRPYKMYDFSNILPSLNVFMLQMKTYLLIPGFRSFHILFTFISLPVTAYLILFNRKIFSAETKFFLVFFFIFSFSVLCAPIINGNYTGFDTFRYNAACFYFSIIALALFAAYLIEFKIHKQNIKHAVSTLIVIFFLSLISFKFSPGGLKNYSNYYPELVKEIDSLSDKYQLKHGIGWQRYAKYITAFSKKNLEVVTVHTNACIWEMGSNINWYYDNDFDFVITHGLNLDFAKTFKIRDTLMIRDELNNVDITILKVEKFHYPKGTYAPITK